jgi:hypothetical protein
MEKLFEKNATEIALTVFKLVNSWMKYSGLKVNLYTYPSPLLKQIH